MKSIRDRVIERINQSLGDNVYDEVSIEDILRVADKVSGEVLMRVEVAGLVKQKGDDKVMGEVISKLTEQALDQLSEE